MRIAEAWEYCLRKRKNRDDLKFTDNRFCNRDKTRRMTKYLLLLLNITITYCSVSGQDFATYLKANAIKVDRLDSLNKQVYDLLSDKRLIMIGEIHGTNEPAKFIAGLSTLFTRYGDSVQIGFEIPSELMTTFLNLQTDSSIYHSDFFSKGSTDCRASVAWAATLSQLNNNPKIKIFFYDLNKSENKNYDGRDSLMYVKIKNKIKEHLTWTTITLSGNVHNMLLPYKGQNKTANYLSKDTELNIADKFCSLNHYYQSGTMLNNIGNGLELRQVGNNSSDYSNLVDYDNYLFLFPNNRTNNYNGIYFTRTVTAAELANKK